LSRAVLRDRFVEQVLLVLRRTPATIDDEPDPVALGIRRGPAQGMEENGIELGHTRNLVVEDRRAFGDGAVSLAERTMALAAEDDAARSSRPGRKEVDGECGRRGR